MSEKTSPTAPNANPSYENLASAPIVYFDLCGAHGVTHGTIHLEVAARAMSPVP